MSYESDNAENVLLDWRSKWAIVLEDIEARFEELKDSRISDLESAFGDLETAIDASKEDCPCEDGIRDFVTSLPGVDEDDGAPPVQLGEQVALAGLPEVSVRAVCQQDHPLGHPEAVLVGAGRVEHQAGDEGPQPGRKAAARHAMIINP